MIIEQQNKRLNEQKDCIIKELTDTIELLHNELSKYESKDNKTESLVDESKIKELESTIELLKNQFEYSQARCTKIETKYESLKQVVDDAKASSRVALSNKAFKAQNELTKVKHQLSVVASRYDKFKNFIISNGRGDLVSEFLKLCDKEDGVSQKSVSKESVQAKPKEITPSVVARNASKNVIGAKNNAVVVKVIPDYENYMNETEASKHERLTVTLGNMIGNLGNELKSSTETEKTEEKKGLDGNKKAEVEKTSGGKSKNKETYTEKVEQKDEINSQLVKGYNYDWESRAFWMEDNKNKMTHLESVPDIRKAAYVDGNNEIFAFHVEVEDGTEDKFETSKNKFVEAYKKDIINNGVILKNGLIDTSGLLMLSEDESSNAIKEIINKADGKDINPVINLAVFYDSVVRGFTTEELVTRYGLEEECITTAVGSLTNLFRARQLSSVHKSYMSVETVCLIESALNKESITNIEPTFAKLYVLYIDGYGIDELIRLFEIEKIKDKFVSSLIEKNAYKEIDEETDLHFRKDCFNKELTVKQIAKMYDIPELMCVHMKNMYNRYYNIMMED